MIDEYANLKSQHEFDEQALLTHQRHEYINEDERMSGAEQALMVMEIQGILPTRLTRSRRKLD
jgi:hypothetical protein